MDIIKSKDITTEEYEQLYQYLKFGNPDIEFNLINGYIKVKDMNIYYYKNIKNDLYSLNNNVISYVFNITVFL